MYKKKATNCWNNHLILLIKFGGPYFGSSEKSGLLLAGGNSSLSDMLRAVYPNPKPMPKPLNRCCEICVTEARREAIIKVVKGTDDIGRTIIQNRTRKRFSSFEFCFSDSWREVITEAREHA